MCGIAGVIHRGATSGVGREMTAMLQAMKHRGPDSTGFALYRAPCDSSYVVRLKLAEREDFDGRHVIRALIAERAQEVEKRIRDQGAIISDSSVATPYARRYVLEFDGDMAELARYLEELDQVEILSFGRALELIKDLGDANEVSDAYGLNGFSGTHAVGHTRMATESDVDIRSAHPYWAFPYSDICVVHNGQITNYWSMRREMERMGHRFVSNCDSELLAVYTARNLSEGVSLEESLSRSVEEIDGVFTYLVATKDELGMAKDTMAAKPLVLYESDDLIALASEEVAIRSVLPHEIDTSDPYDEEVRVWKA